jgi:hypothetical protein
MSFNENLGSFVKENGRLAREWVEAKLEVYKLSMIKYAAKTAGYIMWSIISLFLFFTLVIFLGLTAGFWLSAVTGSYAIGFGIVTLIIILKMIILTKFRKKIFINPIIRAMIKHSNDNE